METKKQGSREERHENPADCASLLSWASHKAFAWLDTNRSRSLCFIHMADSILIHRGYFYTSEKRGQPSTSCTFKQILSSYFSTWWTFNFRKSLTNNIPKKVFGCIGFDSLFQCSCFFKRHAAELLTSSCAVEQFFDELLSLLFVLSFTVMCTRMHMCGYKHEGDVKSISPGSCCW